MLYKFSAFWLFMFLFSGLAIAQKTKTIKVTGEIKDGYFMVYANEDKPQITKIFPGDKKIKPKRKRFSFKKCLKSNSRRFCLSKKYRKTRKTSNNKVKSEKNKTRKGGNLVSGSPQTVANPATINEVSPSENKTAKPTPSPSPKTSNLGIELKNIPYKLEVEVGKQGRHNFEIWLNGKLLPARELKRYVSVGNSTELRSKGINLTIGNDESANVKFDGNVSVYTELLLVNKANSEQIAKIPISILRNKQAAHQTTQQKEVVNQPEEEASFWMLMISLFSILGLIGFVYFWKNPNRSFKQSNTDRKKRKFITPEPIPTLLKDGVELAEAIKKFNEVNASPSKSINASNFPILAKEFNDQCNADTVVQNQSTAISEEK